MSGGQDQNRTLAGLEIWLSREFFSFCPALSLQQSRGAHRGSLSALPSLSQSQSSANRKDSLSSGSAPSLQQGHSEGTLSALLLLPRLWWPPTLQILLSVLLASLSPLPEHLVENHGDEGTGDLDSFGWGLPRMLNYQARSYSAFKNSVGIHWFLFTPSAVGLVFCLPLLCQHWRQPWIAMPRKGPF